MAERKKNMEQAILRTAERLFIKQGYAETSTVQIAKKLGVNQALIYYYFRSKDNLLETIFERKFRSSFAAIFGAEIGEGAADVVLERLLREHFAICRANADFLRFWLDCLAKNKRLEVFAADLAKATVLTRLSELLQRGVGEGTFRAVDPALFASTVLSLNAAPFLLSPILRIIASKSYADYDAFLRAREEENVRLLLTLLRP